MTETRSASWSRFDSIPIDAAAAALVGKVERTPLEPIPSDDPRIELRAKLENRQVTGAFKARGATFQISSLDDAARSIGVVACSSGNHGKALAWAAREGGVKATIVMPKDAYPNKIAACREFGASVVLSESRAAAEDDCQQFIDEGWTLIHPYDAERTVAGAGTVGREIAEDWPEVDVVIFPVGGGGLSAGSSLALRRALGDRPTLLAAEPSGAPSMKLGLEAGEPVDVEPITTRVQGLCPIYSGALNISICGTTLDGVVLLDDPEIIAAQARLVRGGEIVEPAGAAAAAVVYGGHLPESLFEGKSAEHPLRVAVVISGGNPDPDQLEALRLG